MAKNFFELYHAVTKRSEPPVNFQAWTAIAAISALLGKKCFIPQGHFTVFPNLYIVLIGDPGTRKSTAMNIGKNLVRLVDRVPIAPESASREALIDTMAEGKVDFNLYGRDASYWQTSAFVGELEQFFGGKHINQQMVGFLTAIWDEPHFEERTRKSGKVIIRNPYFSMLGCCTASWMNTKLRSDVISDGFSRRTIFVYESELNTMNPWPEASEQEEENLKLLKAEAVRIHSIGGKFNFTPEAMKMWMELYGTFREEAKAHSEKVQHYFSSKHILVQKLCICLSAAFRNDRVVDSVILKLACQFLEVTERNLDSIFSGVGQNQYKHYEDKALKLIEENGGGNHGTLYGSFSADLTTAEFKEVMDALILSHRVSVQSDAHFGTLYRAVKVQKPQEAVNLLQLACHTKVSAETISEETRLSSQVYQVDPVTELLQARLKQKKLDSDKGLLLRGKKTLFPQDAPPPSQTDRPEYSGETPASPGL